jgi:predicted AAA+ superfamily ATPase
MKSSRLRLRSRLSAVSLARSYSPGDRIGSEPQPSQERQARLERLKFLAIANAPRVAQDFGEEIDLLLEDRAGAIEVKPKASLSARDWRSLSRLRDALGDRFRCGCVIHLGADTVPLGDRLFALPLSALWA